MSYGGGPQQQYGDANDYAQPSGQYGQPQQMWQQPQQQYGQAGAYASQLSQYVQQPSAPPMNMQVRGALTPDRCLLPADEAWRTVFWVFYRNVVVYGLGSMSICSSVLKQPPCQDC